MKFYQKIARSRKTNCYDYNLQIYRFWFLKDTSTILCGSNYSISLLKCDSADNWLMKISMMRRQLLLQYHKQTAKSSSALCSD